MKYIGRNYRGNPAYLADIPATWWSLWLACIARDHPDIKIVLIQAAGSAAASAGTHADGWAVDLQTWHLTREQRERLVAHMRRHGASGTWYRFPPVFEPHIHAALDPGGRETNSSYQVAAVKSGYDGLGYRGRKGRDIHPAPAEWITAEEGIRRMAAHFPDFEDETMISSEGLNQFAGVVDHNVWEASLGSDGTFHTAFRGLLSDVRDIKASTRDIRRGSPDPEWNPLNQEVADAKTYARAADTRLKEQEAKLAEVETKVDKLASGMEALLKHAGVAAE